jgi:hypothetical protein
MDIEQVVKARHDFEDRLKVFLKLASLLTDRELEIALGRLADMLASRHSEQLHIQLKGQVLKSYYDLRKQGVRKQRKMARWQYRSTSEEFVETAADFWLLPGNQLEPPPSPTNTTVDDMVKLLTS